MKKQLLIIGIIVLLVCVGLSGCDSLKSDRDKFVGSWKFANTNSTPIIFLSNGTYIEESILDSKSGTWDIQEHKLVIDINQQKTEYNYSFSNNDRTLTLTIVGTTTSYIFTKQ